MPPPMQTLSAHSSGQEEVSYQMKPSFAYHEPDMKWYNHHELSSDIKADASNAQSQVVQPSANILSLHKQVNSLSGKIDHILNA